MEIISYLGYQPNKSKVKYFFNRFITQKKTKSSVLFDFSQSQNFVNRSNYVPNAKVSAKLILVSLGRFVSYVAENIKSILKFGFIGALCITAICSVVACVKYSKNHTGPLVLNSSAETEFEVLDKLMSSFALEATPEYLEDGTLVNTLETDITDLFCQPVTYTTYKVLSGDTISGITKKFGLKNISTLIAVNNIDNVRQVCAGQKLKIPSYDGIIYTVKKGDSLDSIVKANKIDLESLLDVNELSSETLTAGQQLFLPGASLDSKSLKTAMGDKFIMPIAAKFRWSSPYGSRIDPIAGVKSFHTGTDMACPTGTPILASMSGKVIATGTPDEIKNNQEVITAYLGE
mgnify:CR=1 FL=1